MVGVYLPGRLFYRVEVTGTLANPDQRIADDRAVVHDEHALPVFSIFLNGTITMVAFSGVLWSISRLFFVVAGGYAALGLLFAVLLRPAPRPSSTTTSPTARPTFATSSCTCARTPSRW